MATKEFFSTNHLGQQERYTPERVTYNGTVGHFWSMSVLLQNCWVFQHRSFFPMKATRKQIAG